MIPALNARRTPHRAAVIDDDGEITFKELDDAAHAVANGLLAMGVKGGDGVAILARNHRWFLSPSTARPVSAPASSCSTASSPGRRSRRCPSARAPRSSSTTTSTPRPCRRPIRRRASCAHSATNPDKDEPSGSTDETLAELIARSSTQARPEGDEALVDHHPDQRHHRHAQGRQPQHAAVAGADRRRAVACAVQGQRGDIAARADVPRAGLPARHDRDDARLDAGAAATLQAGDRARRHREAQGDRDGRGAGDAVADPRRVRQDGAQARPVVAADRVRVRLAARRRTGHTGAQGSRSGRSTTSTGRRRSRSRPSRARRTCRSTPPPSGRSSRA